MTEDATTGLIAALRADEPFRKEFFAANSLDDAAAIATRRKYAVSLPELEALAGPGVLRDFDLTNAGAWFERVRKRFTDAGLFYDRPPTIRLQGNGLLFLDALSIAERDFAVVTRTLQNNNTQHWRIFWLGGSIFRIMQVSSSRFLDAHEIAQLDFRVVTRPFQDNNTQWWRMTEFGGGFLTLQQVSSGLFVDAQTGPDFPVVLRPSGASSQTWRRVDP